MEERNNQKQPYTAEEIAETAKNVSATVRETVSEVILAYLHEYKPEYTHDNGAESIVESVLPVVLCLMEDAIFTGKRMAEKEIVQEFHRIADMAKGKMSRQPNGPAN